VWSWTWRSSPGAWWRACRVQGDQIVEHVRFTRVYARRGDDWQMIAGQGTRIAPALASTAQAQAEHVNPPPRE
jgi:hypothetical protein